MKNKHSPYQPTIALVSGYIPDIDTEHKFALAHGLHNRVALAFDTYNPERGEMCFDAGMFRTLFSELARRIFLCADNDKRTVYIEVHIHRFEKILFRIMAIFALGLAAFLLLKSPEALIFFLPVVLFMWIHILYSKRHFHKFVYNFLNNLAA